MVIIENGYHDTIFNGYDGYHDTISNGYHRTLCFSPWLESSIK
jgi:hypothetical protein